MCKADEDNDNDDEQAVEASATKEMLSFQLHSSVASKGRPPKKKNVYFRALPESGGGGGGGPCPNFLALFSQCSRP